MLKSQIEASALLEQLVPLHEWLGMRPRTESDVAAYHACTEALHDIARNGELLGIILSVRVQNGIRHVSVENVYDERQFLSPDAEGDTGGDDPEGRRMEC